MKVKRRAVLFGPFVGEVNWELYRFAPLLIYYKKRNPFYKFLVLTRTERFDLYGLYADILLPLRLACDDLCTPDCFDLLGITEKSYKEIINFFYKKYEKRFNIENHIYPDIKGWRGRLRWQFSRDELDFQYRPRLINVEMVKNYLGDLKDEFIFSSSDNYIENTISFQDFLGSSPIDDFNITTLGCAIEFIRRCKYVVCNLDEPIARLALLMNKPVISKKNNYTKDRIHLLNPSNTTVLLCKDYNKGVNYFNENIIRSEKGGPWRQRGVINAR